MAKFLALQILDESINVSINSLNSPILDKMASAKF
jgi:hypothetical protein